MMTDCQVASRSRQESILHITTTRQEELFDSPCLSLFRPPLRRSTLLVISRYLSELSSPCHQLSMPPNARSHPAAARHHPLEEETTAGRRDEDEERLHERSQNEPDRRHTRPLRQQKPSRNHPPSTASSRATTSTTAVVAPPDPRPLQAYIPPYLGLAVKPHHGDFCYSTCFHPQLLTQLMAEGFLPIAAGPRILLPKLHEFRCVVPLVHAADMMDGPTTGGSSSSNSSSSSRLHVSKSTRKKAKRFAISANSAFDNVVRLCHAQHGAHSWLHPPLVQALQDMFRERETNMASVAVPVGEGSNGHGGAQQRLKRIPVRVYSIEVWDLPTGDLVAGELGYSVGAIYTSLTGFSNQDSAGSVQLAALGQWLKASGFCLWDLGMDMDYKRAMGAVLWSRHDFVTSVHALRDRGEVQLLRHHPVPPTTASLSDADTDTSDCYEAKSLIDSRVLVPVHPGDPMSTNHPQPHSSETSRQTKKARSGPKIGCSLR